MEQQNPWQSYNRFSILSTVINFVNFLKMRYQSIISFVFAASHLNGIRNLIIYFQTEKQEHLHQTKVLFQRYFWQSDMLQYLNFIYVDRPFNPQKRVAQCLPVSWQYKKPRNDDQGYHTRSWQTLNKIKQIKIHFSDKFFPKTRKMLSNNRIVLG